MSCSAADIERKRKEALLRRQKSSPYPSPKNVVRSQIQKTPFSPATKITSGTCYLISESRFEVKPSGFHEKLIDIFKSIPSKSYNPETKLWNFSTDHYEEFQKKVNMLKPDVVMGVIPAYVLNAVKGQTSSQLIDIHKIEPTLRDKLMPFQVDGVRFGIEKRGRCLIADDMGLGKTFQALAIADYYREDWPLLIITTSSMREMWQSKIHELIPSILMMSIVCLSSGKDKALLMDTDTKVVIISYKLTALLTESLIEKRFGTVIMDESHLIKTRKAQSTDAVMKITRNSKHVILLSGTPALSRPCELFTQLQIIEPRFFNGFVEYGKRYCDGKLTTFGWDMSGQSNLTELQLILSKKFLIRRTKDQVLDGLKEKSRQTVILNSSLLNINDTKKEALSQLATEYGKRKAADKHSVLLTFFSETAKSKIPAIRKYIKTVVKEEVKFLVFAHHKVVIDSICQTLDELNINYISIDGSTKTDIRNLLVEKFQFKDSCKCAVLSITAANAGITLTAAQLVLFAELHWNPGIVIQAESRAHRIGQTGNVNIRYLIAKGTSDDYMWPMLEKKLQVLNEVGLSKDTFKGSDSTSQDSLNSSMLSNYLSIKSQDDFIPGTNLKKNFEQSEQSTSEFKTNNSMDCSISSAFDEEGDELLGQLDF